MTMPQPTSKTAAPLEALAGTVERVTYHNAENGFAVLKVQARGKRDLVTVIGHAASVMEGEWVTASGSWVSDRTHGVQFTLSATPPTGAEGIEKYLASGQMRGIVRRCRNGSLRPLVRLPRHARPEPPLYGRDARQAPCGSRGPEARHRHCSAGWADEAAPDKASRMALVTESVTGIPSARLREPTKWSPGRAVPVGGRRLYGDAWRKAERHDVWSSLLYLGCWLVLAVVRLSCPAASWGSFQTRASLRRNGGTNGPGW